MALEVEGVVNRHMSGELVSAFTRGRSSPDSLGVALAGNGMGPAILSLWLVEATNGQGEKRITIQSIAVGTDGTRLPALDRQVDQVLWLPPADAFLSVDERLGIFSQLVEPALQREVRHKGTASGDGSYSAELIGYIEITLGRSPGSGCRHYSEMAKRNEAQGFKR